MGMIPIVLSLAGFVFLWALLSYNSLKARRSGILAALKDSQLLFEQRNKLMAALINVYPGLQGQLQGLIMEAQYLAEPRFGTHTLSTHTALAKKIEEALASVTHETADATTELIMTNRSFIERYSAFRTGMKGFNNLIIEAPTRFAAKAFNFQPIQP
jgi:hypothetical protein